MGKLFLNTKTDPETKPVAGKTYSLFGQGNPSTAIYYQIVEELVDVLLKKNEPAEFILQEIQQLSRYRDASGFWFRKKLQSKNKIYLIKMINDRLSPFTSNVPDHLKSLSLFKRFDRTLVTTEMQYHFFMIEIELTNRINNDNFKATDIKLALLPHCLRYSIEKCKMTYDDIDFICRGCVKSCFINHVSQLLKSNGIKPYIWMSANLQHLFKKLVSEGKRPGVLGIACIPELVQGMRKCSKYNIPVIGLPLNANRCARWMGDFYENSVDLKKLEQIVS